MAKHTKDTNNGHITTSASEAQSDKKLRRTGINN